MASNKVGLLYLSGDTLLEAISNNYAKLVLSTDTLPRINRGGIRQKNHCGHSFGYRVNVLPKNLLGKAGLRKVWGICRKRENREAGALRMAIP